MKPQLLQSYICTQPKLQSKQSKQLQISKVQTLPAQLGGQNTATGSPSLLVSWCLHGHSTQGHMMPELDPLLGVIVRCVFGGHYEESYWKDDCLQKLIQLNRLCKSYQSIHSKQKMQLLMEAKASTNCTHRGTELIKS